MYLFLAISWIHLYSDKEDVPQSREIVNHIPADNLLSQSVVEQDVSTPVQDELPDSVSASPF